MGGGTGEGGNGLGVGGGIGEGGIGSGDGDGTGGEGIGCGGKGSTIGNASTDTDSTRAVNSNSIRMGDGKIMIFSSFDYRGICGLSILLASVWAAL